MTGAQGRVLAREGSRFRVALDGQEVTAILRGKARRDQYDRVVVGDQVTLDQGDRRGVYGITAVLPRRNLLERRTPLGRGNRPVAANLDRVFVVTAATNPAPVPQLIDRLTAIAEANEIPAAIVVNKVDLDPGEELVERYRAAGYEVYPVSARTGAGLEPWFEALRGRESLLTGPSGAGKSSLLNRLVGEKLAIVSPKAQTTRHVLTGILTTGDCQYLFVDLPGFQTRHVNVLNRALNRRAAEGARDCDVVAFVVEALRFGPADRAVLARIPAAQRAVAVVNKIDLVKNRLDLLPFLQRLAAEREFAAIVPVSARTGKNVAELLRVLREALPEGPAAYPAEQLTDRDERFFAAELLREKLFRELGEELPYRCEVALESFREEAGLRRIEATIFVERDSQKPIVLGAKGATLKRIASAARRDMERLFGGKVYLGVWVKVKHGWTDDARALKQLGYA